MDFIRNFTPNLELFAENKDQKKCAVFFASTMKFSLIIKSYVYKRTSYLLLGSLLRKRRISFRIQIEHFYSMEPPPSQGKIYCMLYTYSPAQLFNLKSKKAHPDGWAFNSVVVSLLIVRQVDGLLGSQ